MTASSREERGPHHTEGICYHVTTCPPDILRAFKSISFDLCGRVSAIRRALAILCSSQHVFCEECLYLG
ncbi:hypothetical protein J4Q44_G00168510 [Coregonus suidteri]|uniref:Uncharacterized protein n=1 Tax=Coregonus suidteri TaxID=861788 RepID=A0AAN8QRG6_9TELE